MKKPHVIIVMTDDQGYPDLGCTGNPWIQTPNIDEFHDDSVRFTDFHVQPLCTPTRGAMMSGHRPVRNGAWATCWGRSIMRRDETTLADRFKAAGYQTALFGKWHLGDNYPYRPFDRGFDHVVAHKGGGVGQTPDFWGNNYFDDTYFHNGEPVGHDGYCTDVWFDEAMKFIAANHDHPFFACIHTNAPHSPYLVAEKYRRLYEDNPDIPEPAFYGMITNIDENFGRLRQHLKDLDIEDDTILIFMTDNGSSGAAELDQDGFVERGYNAGMRGKKASYYDGGHRVPFFVRWPTGRLEGGVDRTEMCLDIDLMPTFTDLCGLSKADDSDFDGRSFAPILRGESECFPDDRVHFLQYHQGTEPPLKWTCAVMTRRWRLINGRELYDIQADPGQKQDVARQNQDVVERLRKAYEQWWTDIEPELQDYAPIVLGNDAENPTRLDAMDVMGDVVWHQTAIAEAMRCSGRWTVEIEQPGNYTFALRRWPQELDLPLDAAPPDSETANLAPYMANAKARLINPRTACLTMFGRSRSADLQINAKEAVFELDIEQSGKTELEAEFELEDGSRQGAYYVYVRRNEES